MYLVLCEWNVDWIDVSIDRRFIPTGLSPNTAASLLAVDKCWNSFLTADLYKSSQWRLLWFDDMQTYLPCPVLHVLGFHYCRQVEIYSSEKSSYERWKHVWVDWQIKRGNLLVSRNYTIYILFPTTIMGRILCPGSGACWLGIPSRHSVGLLKYDFFIIVFKWSIFQHFTSITRVHIHILWAGLS